MDTEIVVLSHTDSGASAQVLVSQGFNCFSWKAGPGELLYAPDGFDTGEGRASSGGCPLLFPFPGRIQAGQFEFQGKTYHPPAGDGIGNALHGYVFNRPWRLVDQQATSVTGEFQGTVDAPETLDYWPADYKITVTYRLEATRLVCDVVYQNPGHSDLPCGFGTHAYFRLPLDDQGDPDQAQITVPVDAQWKTQDLIPSGETEVSEAATGLANGLTLKGWEFDSVFRLDPAAQQPIVSSVKSGPWRLTQTCDQQFQCYVVYTPGHRQAVCIEPYTNVPAPFTLNAKSIDSGLAILAPGESRKHQLTLAIEPAE